MFGLFSKKDETKNLLHGTDTQAENIRIHTMDRDLESLIHPQKEEGEDLLGKAPRPEHKAGLNGLSEQQKSSPFFEKPKMPAPNPPMPVPLTPPAPKPKLESFAKPVSGPLLKDIPSSDPKAKPNAVTKETVQSKDGAKKLILILVVILIIIAVLAGGYYFWNVRKNIPPEETVAEEQAPEVLPEEEGSGEEEQSKTLFSATDKNYFMLDSGGDSLTSFRGMVGDYYEKIAADQISYPVEFTIINKENDPISFGIFAQALGIKFSPEMMSALEDSFNFYIYNDQGNPGVGLALKVKEEMNPEEILLREEKNLPGEVEPLFPVSQYTIERTKVFDTSEHDSASWGKIGIRFQNIISPENLSVDYTFVNTGANMLFISTTRATLRSIIDNTKPAVIAP